MNMDVVVASVHGCSTDSDFSEKFPQFPDNLEDPTMLFFAHLF